MKFILALSLPTMALAGSVLNPRQANLSQLVTLASVTTSGSGCPANSTIAVISPDSQAVTVAFSTYVATIGDNSYQPNFDKDCNITLAINFPPGCTSVEFGANYRGFAQIEGGALGVLNASYSSSIPLTGGDPPATTFTTSPENSDYVASHNFSASVSVGGTAQEIISFFSLSRITLTASNPESLGHMTADTVDFVVSQQSNCAYY